MQAKKLYNEAMEKGYAECSTIRCLIHGSAGVGKTHVKHLLLKMPPPKLRTSTGIADNPVRAVTVSAVGVSKQDEDDWHVLDGDYDLMRTVSQMIKGYVEPLPKKDDSPMVQPTSRAIQVTQDLQQMDMCRMAVCYLVHSPATTHMM